MSPFGDIFCLSSYFEAFLTAFLLLLINFLINIAMRHTSEAPRITKVIINNACISILLI